MKLLFGHLDEIILQEMGKATWVDWREAEPGSPQDNRLLDIRMGGIVNAGRRAYNWRNSF